MPESFPVYAVLLILSAIEKCHVKWWFGRSRRFVSASFKEAFGGILYMHRCCKDVGCSHVNWMKRKRLMRYRKISRYSLFEGIIEAL